MEVERTRPLTLKKRRRTQTGVRPNTHGQLYFTSSPPKLQSFSANAPGQTHLNLITGKNAGVSFWHLYFLEMCLDERGCKRILN
jgi:hypothetical protein